MIQSANLARLPGIRHAFFTREGGVSEGPFAALNCGYASGDAPARVARNRALALERLGLQADRLATVRQIHSADVVTVAAVEPGLPSRAADALVSDCPGIALGVLSADCAPVLLADPETGVIGAAHAGWRGALEGVLEATVAAMRALGARPERVHAAIGPCIAQASYEVGPELQAQVVREDAGAARLFREVAGSDRLLFDLEGYAVRRLARCGVGAHGLGLDTASDKTRFFSSRVARRHGNGRFGLLLSVIARDA